MNVQYPGDAVSFTISGDASKMTSTSPLDVKSVVYGDDTRTGCPYDYVRIPGGSEDGNTHTARERYCGQSLGFCRVQVQSCRGKYLVANQISRLARQSTAPRLSAPSSATPNPSCWASSRTRTRGGRWGSSE